MNGRVLSFPWPQLSANNFDAFWQLYPRRVAKLDAQRAWARLSGTDRAEVLRRLPLFVDYWANTRSEKRYVLHPATFLNGRRWEDEIDHDLAPMLTLGQCEWNKNGNRDPHAGRCSAQASLTADNGAVYCRAHGLSLGLGKRRA
jgi:hypothetical protein